MGEEEFQLHVATPTYATHPMSLYNTRQAQQDCLSLLVLNRSSVPAGVQKGSSFPAGAYLGLLSLLVLTWVFFPSWCFTNLLFLT